ncbi:thiamine pyrophosphate-binding protein [Paracoccus niistensis]|uniref:Thiamine pyrophosphate-binding protein n=1 Tax=Paracoccus niistensis TaxID=632935 RepID=A0ABV6I8Q8_9RHOB
MRGANLVTEALASAGVTTIFSLSGNQIMPVYDACLDTGLRIIHTRHEAAAVFMADAHAQLTGTLGVCMVTAAPGAANALGPLFSARLSESPVLFLTGDSPVAQDGRGAFQELDQVALTSPLTKLSLRPKSAGELRDALVEGARTALSGRPGPVHIALPFDVLEAESNILPPSAEEMGVAPDPVDLAEIVGIAAKLAQAERPLVILGPALAESRTGDLAARLADRLDVPVVAMESPRGLNDPSLGGFGGMVAEADLIVALGKPVDFTLGFGKPAAGAAWVVVSAEAAELQRARTNLGDRIVHELHAPPGAVARALLDHPPSATRRGEWRSRVAGAVRRRAPHPDTDPDTDRITPGALCAAVQRCLDRAPSSVVICDGGEFGQWAQAGTRGTRRIINGPSGAIGGGPCYALGAKVAAPGATVIALMGDGTVGFHLAEFETAARAGTPFVAVIGNDGRWNAEHQIQLRNYGEDRLVGCELSDARYDLVVEALGGHGGFVERLEDLDAALERAVASGKVACVNVVMAGLPAPSGSGH